MFTVCPKCALTLVVTAADLRVAQGYVRCGRCSNVFNALNALSDERTPEPPHTPAPPEKPPARIEPPPPAVSASTSVAAPGSDDDEVIEIEAEAPAESLEFDPTSTSVEDVFVAPRPGDRDATGTFESIVLEAAEAEPGIEDVTPDPIPPPTPVPSTGTGTPLDADEQLEQELQSLARRIDEQNRPPAQNFSSGAPSNAASAAETLEELGGGFGGRRPHEEEDDDDEDAAPAWALRSGIAALILLLLAQAVHHYRRDLAVVPQLGAPLEAIYGAIGAPLEPRWDVNAYEVRQLGAASDPSTTNRLIVRASVKNGAPRPQPLPLLRVAVQDRFGNRIAASDVAPAAYAPHTASTQTRLDSGQRVDVEMRFVDPGAEAVGFEIDACLAAPGGGVNCANR